MAQSQKFPILKTYSSWFSALNNPQKIQEYLQSELEYNYNDTLRSFRGVVENKTADCFEGAVSFASILLYYWRFYPKIVFIQAENDADHTLVVYKKNGKYGSVAMSRHKELMGKPPQYHSLFDLVYSYYPDYTSDYPEFLGQLSMRGFSDPIDLVDKFGTEWFFLPGDDALEFIYDHITDDIMCTSIFTRERYPYPPEIE